MLFYATTYPYKKQFLYPGQASVGLTVGGVRDNVVLLMHYKAIQNKDKEQKIFLKNGKDTFLFMYILSRKCWIK
ncbi:hypothetical protein BH09BAC2_BH09BAC2_13320 [soil metagenome]